MFGFQSEYREGTRNKVFTGLGGNTVAAVGRRKFPFALAFTAERGDIHHLSGTIESWELPGDGPFLFPFDAQAKLGLIKDMAKSRIFVENKPGFYLRMYKDAKTGLMLINVADFDLLNDQALTPQLLRASKPMYALAATIPPPTCLTGGATASGEQVDILRSVTPLPGNHTLRFTHVAIGLDVMDEYPDTDGHIRRYISERHCGRIRDVSLGDREDRQMLVKTLRRRFPEEVHQTNIVLIDCRAFRDPASSALRNRWGVHPTTLSKVLNHHKFPGLLLELVERAIRFADKDPKTRILIGFICLKSRHRSVACSYLMQVIHTALNYTVNTRTTAIASSGRHLCNRDTCPDCSHLSVAAVRLMESVRERLVASWNKAVASAVSTSQHPKPSVTLTSMLAIPVTPAVGISWRVTEKAPPPQPSKRASFFKGTLEQARLAGLTDEEIASIAVVLKPVLEKEEKSGDSRRSVKRGVLPEACSSQTLKRGKAVLEPSSNPGSVSSGKHDEYRARDHLTQAGSTSTPATTTVPLTESATAATTQTAVTITGTRKPSAPPPATQFLGTGRHPRTTDREETLRVLMRKTKFSGHSNVDTDIADNDDHYLESLFVGRMKSGIIYLGPDEIVSNHKIRVNLKIGTKNTRIGVPRELEEWMKITLYRDNTTLRWILFEDRVAPRHQRQFPDGADLCVCMLQPARTTIDGVSYMASCRTAMSRGQRRVFESHARQMEQDDRFVSGVLTAQSCEKLLHYDVEPNASSDIMIVSDIDLPFKPSSKYIVTSHSLQPELSAQPSTTSDSILCTAHALLETCCQMNAKLLILTIAYPGAWKDLFHVELCNVLHTLAEHGIDFVYRTPCRVSSQYNLPRDFPHSECRGDLTVYSTSSRIVQRTLDWGRHREWSFAPFYCSGCGKSQLLERSLASFC